MEDGGQLEPRNVQALLSWGNHIRSLHLGPIPGGAEAPLASLKMVDDSAPVTAIMQRLTPSTSDE
jgi:hypothetical protein